MIMAGGDIAPVEPVVEAPAVEASGWDFSGQGVVYYQTIGDDTNDLFDQGEVGEFSGAAATAGLKLKVTNNDVLAGIGMGFAVNGISTLNLENSIVSDGMQGAGNVAAFGAGNDVDDLTDGGWLSEAYLTYGFGNTSIKAGRQTLPKSLSPFAFSESWNVFENTFDSILVVNSDIQDTAIVGVWVQGANFNSFGPVATSNNMTDFNSVNSDDGVYLLTVQNKSIENLTLTGSFYYGQDFAGGTDDLEIFWGDAAYDAGDFTVAIQGGSVDVGAADDITSFGAKIAGSVSGVNLMAAYSDVEDGFPFQLGGTTSALYTTTVTNQLVTGIVETDSDKVLLAANTDVLGGNLAAAYAMTDSDVAGDTDEFNLVYSTNVTDALALTAAYVYVDADTIGEELDVVRVIANYNF